MIIFIQTLLMIITFGQFTLYNITYVDRTIDTPIEELNNHTLREVFDDGNMVVNGDFNLDINSDNIPDGFIIGGVGYISTLSLNDGLWLLNQEQTIQSGVSFRSIRYDVTLNTSNDYLVITETKSSNTLLRQYLGAISFKENSLIPNVWNTTLNYIKPSGNNMYIGYNQLGTFEIRNIMLIDVVSLGISNLTVEQMNHWFTEYQEVKDVSDHNYTYTINEVTLTDFMIVLSSAVIWFFVIKFLKEVF